MMQIVGKSIVLKYNYWVYNMFVNLNCLKK